MAACNGGSVAPAIAPVLAPLSRVTMRLVEAARFTDPLEAAMAEGALAAEGIVAERFDAGVASAYAGALALAPVRLMVDPDDLAAAKAVLAAAQR